MNTGKISFDEVAVIFDDFNWLSKLREKLFEISAGGVYLEFGCPYWDLNNVTFLTGDAKKNKKKKLARLVVFLKDINSNSTLTKERAENLKECLRFIKSIFHFNNIDDAMLIRACEFTDYFFSTIKQDHTDIFIKHNNTKLFFTKCNDKHKFSKTLQNHLLYNFKCLKSLGVNFKTGFEKKLLDACANGYIDAVRFLVDHGVDIHAENDKAFKDAFSHKNYAIVEYLTAIDIYKITSNKK